MKILHTSDWHIGRKLYNQELEQDLDLFFDWLIKTIKQEKINVLIVAGDIFDLAYPSNSSLEQYYKVLRRLYKTDCKNIIITGGNHDSVSTLNAPKNILKFLNIHIIGGVYENTEEQIIEIKDENNTLELIVCAIPFLRGKDIRQSIAGEEYDERIVAIREGISKYYYNIAEIVKQKYKADIPVIATGHLFVTNVDLPKEEKDLYIGSLQQISSERFPELFNYIALGHIHRPQKVSEKIRYSGSPIPMSFSEREHKKSVVILEKKSNSFIQKVLEIPIFRNLVLFKGNFSEVKNKISSYKDTGILPFFADIEIIEEKSNPELKYKAIKYIENLNIDVVSYKIIFNDNKKNLDTQFYQTTSLKDINVTEIFEKLLFEKDAENIEELKNTFNELMEEI